MTVVSNTGPLIALAKEAGLIPAVMPVLEKIRRQGYWLSDELLKTAAKLAGENG